MELITDSWELADRTGGSADSQDFDWTGADSRVGGQTDNLELLAESDADRTGD